MNKSLIAILAILGTMAYLWSSAPASDEFSQWKVKFESKFTSDEEVYRKGIFLKNLEEINHHNGLLGTTYKKGVNQFTVLTQEEFVEKHLTVFDPISNVNIDEEDKRVGADVDWVAYGAVSSVKN